jgi:hypothetical protein
MRGLDDLVRQGKVPYMGISDTPAWEALHKLAEERFTCSVCIYVGSVDEIAPSLAESVYTFYASSFVAHQPHSSPKVRVLSAASETRRPLCPKVDMHINVLFFVMVGFKTVITARSEHIGSRRRPPDIPPAPLPTSKPRPRRAVAGTIRRAQSAILPW